MNKNKRRIRTWSKVTYIIKKWTTGIVNLVNNSFGEIEPDYPRIEFLDYWDKDGPIQSRELQDQLRHIFYSFTTQSSHTFRLWDVIMYSFQ